MQARKLQASDHHFFGFLQLQGSWRTRARRQEFERCSYSLRQQQEPCSRCAARPQVSSPGRSCSYRRLSPAEATDEPLTALSGAPATFFARSRARGGVLLRVHKLQAPARRGYAGCTGSTGSTAQERRVGGAQRALLALASEVDPRSPGSHRRPTPLPHSRSRWSPSSSGCQDSLVTPHRQTHSSSLDPRAVALWPRFWRPRPAHPRLVSSRRSPAC